ncbi:MAG: WD40/YVTN/BNR-like repeat-containing protein, partial [Terriglobales bacterium]
GAPLPNRSHLYKSTDQGVTWTEVTGATAPEMAGRMGVAVAMHTNGQRVYLIENGPRGGGSGLYRSDDQGASWKRMAAGDSRITNGQGNYSCGVWVDTENPDILYTVSTAAYRSSDGGNTFAAFKGAPGGDDYHNIWIDPSHPERMIFGVDQGATVTLDGGRTWSSWYNQATDQVYHIDTDTRYPYWVAASQQDSGSTMIRSRSDLGQITMMTDWWPLPASEFGSVAMDPVHPGTIYAVGYGAGGSAGSITKISQQTGQWEDVAPNQSPDSYYRPGATVRRFDTAFNPNALYAGYQCLTVTTDGGMSWRDFSPDLTTALGKPEAPCKPAAGAAEAAPPAAGGFGRGRGATIADFSISAAKPGVFWTASSNGQIYRTADNGTQWTNVTHFTDLPEGVNGFDSIEAGHFDAATAYVTMSRTGAGDYSPYIWKTHDGGQTWTRIVNDLPANNRPDDYVWVVREDPVQRGLLYCGTESGVFVSFDDGGNWQSLGLNLPMTAVRDMVFHTADHMSDLVIGTYGRSLWVLDDISPLRELAARAQQIEAVPAYLFKPGDAIRARQNINWDTPIPPDIARAPNPPYGAIIYYYLGQKPAGEVKLQIFDPAGNLVRTYSSLPQPQADMPRDTVAPYWLATPESLALPTAVGTNRAHWDLRYEDPAAINRDLENQMNSLVHQVTPGPHGPKALPGTYTVKLTVDGQVYSQPLVVRNDPRIGESPAIMAALEAQHRLTMLGYQAMTDSFAANQEVAAVRAQVQQRSGDNTPAEVATAAKALETKLTAFGGPTGGRGRGGFGGFGPPPAGTPRVVAFSALNRNFDSLVEITTVGLDMPPTASQIAEWETDCNRYNATLAAWKGIETNDLAAFNAVLSRNNLPPLTLSSTPLGDPACTFTAAPTAAKGKRGKRG